MFIENSHDRFIPPYELWFKYGRSLLVKRLIFNIGDVGTYS